MKSDFYRKSSIYSLPENYLGAKTNRDLIRDAINTFGLQEQFTIEMLIEKLQVLYPKVDIDKETVRATLHRFCDQRLLKVMDISIYNRMNCYLRTRDLQPNRYDAIKEQERGSTPHLSEGFPSSKVRVKACLKLLTDHPYFESYTDGKINVLFKELGLNMSGHNGRRTLRANQTSLRKKGIIE